MSICCRDICIQKNNCIDLEDIQKQAEKCHLSCGEDSAACARSAPQRGETGEETAAGRPEGGTGGTDCPESAGSSPTQNRNRRTK